MSTQANRADSAPAVGKAILRRYLDEVWNERNLGIIDELIADDYVQHAVGIAPGKEGVRQFFARLSAAFPDAQQTVEDMIGEGDKVVWRWTIRATHRGEFLGIAATGNEVTLRGISIVRIADGKLAEHWNVQDRLGMLQQLGVIPRPV